ncbi:MAG: ABC transporter permease [Acidimicrobiales bacterium]
MTDLITYLVKGIPIGCVFALMAVGIVLTYKTSGVLNLAFGAQAYVSAALFYVLRSDDYLGWPMIPAFVVSVVIVAPLVGWILDRGLYRHLRTAPPIAKLVTSLGLLVAIPSIVKLFLGAGAKQRPPGLASESFHSIGEIVIDNNQLVTIVATVLVVIGLTILFRSTALGLQMRAVVESPRMTELAGIDADRVGTISWMLSSFIAGLAGVLLAPLFAAVSEVNFFVLLVAALAAAAFGRLSSIPLTLVGGLALGMLNQLLEGYLPNSNLLATGLRPSLPFVALFLLLLFWPGLRQRREATDPLAGVDPPPPSPVSTIRTRSLTVATRVFAVAVIALFTVVALTGFDAFWLGIFIKGVIFGVIFLSFTILTGMGGQISLCQAAFAATGAFTAAQLVSRTGMPIMIAMVIGAAVAGVLGGIIALPALRLGGIYLALATLAFAVMFENVLKPQDWVSGGTRPPKVPRPMIVGINFNDNKLFLLLCMILLALVATAVVLVKHGTTGRFLDALRGSETAAQSLGISPAQTKVLAFAMSAGIAGFGGGLLASFEGRVSYDANFNYVLGLVWVVLVVTMGARSVQAAITAGISLFLFPRILELIPNLSQTAAQSIAFVMFGLGALTYAKHPEGIVEFQTRRAVQRIVDLLSRRGGGADAAPIGGPPEPAVATAAAGAGGDA